MTIFALRCWRFLLGGKRTIPLNMDFYARYICADDEFLLAMLFPLHFCGWRSFSKAMLRYLIQLCYVSHDSMLSGTPDSSAKFTQRSNKDEAQSDDEILANTATGCWNLPFTDFASPWPTGWEFLTTNTHSGDVSILFIFFYVDGWRHGWQHMLWTRPWQRAHFVPAEGSNAYTSKSAPQASDCQLCARRYVLLFICFHDVSGTAKFSIAGLPKFGCTWLGHPAPLLHCGQVHVQNRSVSMQHRDVPLRRPLACPKGADTLTKTQILSFSDFFQGILGTPFQPEPPRFSHISRSW